MSVEASEVASSRKVFYLPLSTHLFLEREGSWFELWPRHCWLTAQCRKFNPDLFYFWLFRGVPGEHLDSDLEECSRNRRPLMHNSSRSWLHHARLGKMPSACSQGYGDHLGKQDKVKIAMVLQRLTFFLPWKFNQRILKFTELEIWCGLWAGVRIANLYASNRRLKLKHNRYQEVTSLQCTHCLQLPDKQQWRQICFIFEIHLCWMPCKSKNVTWFLFNHWLLLRFTELQTVLLYRVIGQWVAVPEPDNYIFLLNSVIIIEWF